MNKTAIMLLFIGIGVIHADLRNNLTIGNNLGKFETEVVDHSVWDQK